MKASPSSPSIFSKYPDDQYACAFPDCDFVPEIINIDFKSRKIKIRCLKHGDKINEMNIQDYFDKEFNNCYYNIGCSFTQRKQSEDIKNKFTFFYFDGFYYCHNCSQGYDFINRQRTKGNLVPINVNELSNICKLHFKHFTKYCLSCKKHFCDNCKDQCSNHKAEVKEIEKIDLKDIKQKIEEKIKELNKEKETIDLLIQFLNTVYTTYDKHPHNYYNTLNIKKMSDILDSQKNIITEDNKIDKAEKKLDMLEKHILDFFNKKLNLDVKLDGNAVKIDLNNKNIGNFDLELLSHVRFPKLEEIDLSHNKITSVSSLNNLNSKIKKLDLSYNHINGIDELKNVVIKFQLSLKEINFDNNNILPKEIEEIRQLLKSAYSKECCLTYELDKSKDKIRIFGEEFVNNNKNNCKIKEGDEEKDLSEFHVYDKIKNNYNYKITLIMKKDIEKISRMFKDCIQLKEISKIFHIKSDSKIKNLSEMFSGCSSLISLPDSISDWDTSDITDISGLFYGCEKLEKLPDISKWKTGNVTNMMSLFNRCYSLNSLPNLSLWNTSHVNNMSCMFSDCIQLTKMPDIFNWNTENVTDMGHMFYGCKRLVDLSSLSRWNTSKVTIMKNMFKGCTSLSKRPDINKWSMKNVTNKDSMFQGCP